MNGGVSKQHVLLNERHSNIGEHSGQTCFQYRITLRERAADPRPQMTSLDGCSVREVPSRDAGPIIERYEWLGTMGRPVLCVGLFSPDASLLGVACFGWPGSPESRDICGKENRNLAICLERGACVHWAPPNAASFLISRACDIAAQRGWPIVYAYADEDAGEIGNVYQACNWIYLGQGVGRTPGRARNYYRTTDGKILSSRSLRHRKMTHLQAIALGWEVIKQSPKHKYVWFGGSKSQRRALARACKYCPKSYPKRASGTTIPDSLDTVCGAA